MNSAVRLKQHRARAESRPGAGLLLPLSEGSGLPEQDGCCTMMDESPLGSWGLLSQFSPQSLHPQALLKCL